MELALYILEIMGTLVFFSSIFCLKHDAPVAALNPRLWKPVWKQRDYFRGPGYALQITGLIWMLVAGLGLIVIWLT